MRKCVIVLFTFMLTCGLNVKSQEKWNLKSNIGTSYGITDAVFKEFRDYTNNSTWYPGLALGANLSYNVFSWLSLESGINFERIRTGYKMGIYGQSGTFNQNYSKNYLNVPLLLQLRTSPHFGIFGGSGYHWNLSQLVGVEKSLEWNEWLITGGFFVNMGKLRTSLGYTQGMSEKSYLNYSRNRTISVSVSYTLWKK